MGIRTGGHLGVASCGNCSWRATSIFQPAIPMPTYRIGEHIGSSTARTLFLFLSSKARKEIMIENNKEEDKEKKEADESKENTRKANTSWPISTVNPFNQRNWKKPDKK